MNTIKVEKGRTKMIAHRGVSGLETENTNAAFIAAGNRSYWGVETDVHPTADGRLILIHDSNTKRVCGEEMIVEETDSSVLRNLRVKDLILEDEGRTDLRLPFLSEYVDLCKKYEKVCVLELKNKFSEEDVLRVLEEIRRLDYWEGMVYISFHRENLECLRRHAPDSVAQFLASEINEEIFSYAKENGFGLDIHHVQLTEEWVRRCNEAGVVLNCWTVNDRETAERLISWGIDMITTNILE